jgi:hypothetical protein
MRRAFVAGAGIYAIRNLLHLSPGIRKLAWSRKIRSMVEEILQEAALPVRAAPKPASLLVGWLGSQEGIFRHDGDS